MRGGLLIVVVKEKEVGMWYMLIILVLFSLTAFSSLFKLEDKKRNFLFFTCWLLCLSIAGFRDVGVDADSQNYFKVFSDNSNGILVERSFYIISSFVKLFCGVDFLFVLFIYALIGVTAKFVAIRQLTNLWMLSCAIYIANIYILQDMTQIRVGVATGMLLLCIKPLYDRNWKLFLLFSIIGSFFHFASLFIFPLWFLNPKSFNRYFYITLVFVSYCVFYMGFTITDLISVIPLDYVQDKLKVNYELAASQDLVITPFTIMQSLRIGIAALAVWKIDRIREFNKYSVLLLKIYIFGIASFVLFTDIPTFSLRMAEFAGCVEVILIPTLLYAFKNEKIGTWVPICIGAFLLFMNLFVFKLL